MKFKTTADVYGDRYANLTKSKRGDSEIARRERKRMARIQAGEDVETKEESMRILNYHVRHGA